MDSQTKMEKQLKIINGQLLGSILYIASFFITIAIVWNQRKVALDEKEFLTTKESQQLALFNKVLVFGILLLFIYLNYESKDFSKQTGQDTSSLELQIKASWISLIPAFIGLYVVITDFSNTNFQTAEIENPSS